MHVEQMREDRLHAMTREQRVDYWLACLQAPRDEAEDHKFLHFLLGWIEDHEEAAEEVKDAVRAFGFDPDELSAEIANEERAGGPSGEV